MIRARQQWSLKSLKRLCADSCKERLRYYFNITPSGGVNLKEEDRLRPFYELSPNVLLRLRNHELAAQRRVETISTVLEKLGLMCQEAGVKPEIEVFDPGMIYNAGYYIKKVFLRHPVTSSFVWALQAV
jgi:uncharacterized protein (DUF849 family)